MPRTFARLPPMLCAALLAGAAAAAPPVPAASIVARPVAINHDNRERFAAEIERAAGRHGLHPALVHAVISVESGYEPDAVSTKGAMGLMQLMPATAARWGLQDPFDAVANIEAGSRHLGALMRRFGRIQLALAAYNAGPERIRRGAIPRYPETRRYVASVISYYLLYRRRPPWSDHGHR